MQAIEGKNEWDERQRARTQRSLETARVGRHQAGVTGLYLVVTKCGDKQWIYRFKKPSTQRMTETSIGHYPTVTLEAARKKTKALSAEIDKGHDPIEQKREARAKAKEVIPTFKMACAAFGVAFDKTATREMLGHVHRHAKTLMPIEVRAIDTQAVAKALRHVNATTPKIARSCLDGVRRVLDYSRVQGWSPIDRLHPANWDGTFEHIWDKKPPVRHHKAVAYDDVPRLYARLKALDQTSAYALRLLILTGTRTQECLFARFDEVDMSRRTLTVPAERMKLRRSHCIPLGDEAFGTSSRRCASVTRRLN